MRLNLREIEVYQGEYIRRVIAFKLPWAKDDQLERIYQAVINALRKKAEKGYEFKAKYGVKSLRTFLKKITRRRVVDYIRKKGAEERKGLVDRQTYLDVDKIGAADENIENFLKHGPRQHIETIGGVEVRPLLHRLRNQLMWITWAEQNELRGQIQRDKRDGWPDAQRRRVKTRVEIKAEIARDWGISEEAVRLRLYRGKRKFRALYEKERRLQGIRPRPGRYGKGHA
jgi:DNA-directed RNA polymerase specialized sigma24 family protein